MDNNVKQLLLQMLEEANDTLGNNSCNDWRWPENWDSSYIIKFLVGFNAWYSVNHPEDPAHWWGDDEYGPADFLILGYLTHLVGEEL